MVPVYFRINSSNPSIEHPGVNMITKDCINGTWFNEDHFDKTTYYAELVEEFAMAREIEENRENAISFEADLMIYNRTK